MLIQLLNSLIPLHPNGIDTTSEAIIPLIWIVAAAIGGLLIIGGAIAFVSSETEEIPGKSISVLGMMAAGKTTLLRQLQNKPLLLGEYEGTNIDMYETFSLRINDDRVVTIKGGKDIGGGEVYIKDYYENAIRNSDIIFFVFDAFRYMNEITYFYNVNARLDYIYRHAKNYNKYIVTIGSHVDEFDKNRAKGLIKEFQQRIKDKPYASLFTMNFFLLDLTKRKAIENILDKIF